MPSQPSETQELRRKTLLIREVIEVLTEELSTLANRKWEDLPELKKKKVVLASRFREFNQTSNRVEPDKPELVTLKSLMSDLENQSRQKIAAQIDLIGNQMLALQEQHVYWLECLNVSFQKPYEPIPSP